MNTNSEEGIDAVKLIARVPSSLRALLRGSAHDRGLMTDVFIRVNSRSFAVEPAFPG
jgi:hypothetical protein